MSFVFELDEGTAEAGEGEGRQQQQKQGRDALHVYNREQGSNREMVKFERWMHGSGRNFGTNGGGAGAGATGKGKGMGKGNHKDHNGITRPLKTSLCVQGRRIPGLHKKQVNDVDYLGAPWFSEGLSDPVSPAILFRRADAKRSGKRAAVILSV